MNSRLLCGLVAGAAVTTAGYFWITAQYWPPPGLVFYLGTPAIALSFMAAGIAAWLRWPASRLGLLFTIVGYLYLLPALDILRSPVPFTLGNVIYPLSGAALAHLGLAWPTGRLRSGFERGVVIAEYASAAVFSVLSMMFFQPRFLGCTGCPANLMLVRGSRTAWNAVNLASIPVSLALLGIVGALIIEHYRTARGWTRQAMVPLVWISIPIVVTSAVTSVTTNLTAPFLSSPAMILLQYGIVPLFSLLGPLLFVISTVRARTAHGALGTAIVDLEPGAPPGRLRDALARALGDSTLQLAFRRADGPGYLDTSGQAVDPDRPGAGRAVVPLAGAADAVLVHDQGLELEPQLVRLTAAAASMALEHSRLQAEVRAQLELVRASRARIVEAGDTERRRLERDLHDGAQQRLVTLALALGMARGRAAGTEDPELAALIDSAAKEAREALTELRELARGIHPAVLTETGLAGAVQSLVERSPVATTVAEVPDGRFPAMIEATAYFVVSEALANVAKHAMAGGARVAIRRAAGRLVVQVSDDGCGGARLDRGSGLRGLADRVASAGGVLRVDSPPGGGTRLEADIPCP
jgi:signal transduction histidine kinase